MIGTDIKIFSENIIRLIRHMNSNRKFEMNDDQWLSFICKPYRIVDQEFNELSNLCFNQEITEWWSYCCINDIKSDYEYAFHLSRKHVIPSRYHGFSWHFDHLIIPDKDLGVYFLGGIPSTPAFLAEKKLLRDFILSQFIPWTCPVHQVDLLRSLLNPFDLVFSEIPDLSGVDYTVGAICDYLFDPISGMIVTPESWSDLEENSIITRLGKDSLILGLPGIQEGAEVEDFVLSLFEKLLHAKSYLRIDEQGYIPGLPIDHSAREISIQRYTIVNHFNEEIINSNLMTCKTYLESNLDSPNSVEIEAFYFNHRSKHIVCVLSVSWKPNLGESSSESVERLIEAIFQSFNQAIPEHDVDKKDCKSTREIVERYGTIKFNESYGV